MLYDMPDYTKSGSNDMWPMLISAGLGAAGSFMNAGAQNKATREQNQLQQEALQLQREQDRRATETDIFKKLAQTAYLKSGGAQEGPTTINYGGQQTTLPNFGFGPRAASQEQRTAATELEQLLMERLRAPNTDLSVEDAIYTTEEGQAIKNDPNFARQFPDMGARNVEIARIVNDRRQRSRRGY